MLDEKKYRTKKYIHFDCSVNIKTVEGYVTDADKVSVHSFLPLIHYVVSSEKFNQKKYKEKEMFFIDPKERDIKYAGHLDNHIYKYYSETLQSEYYNQWCIENNLDDCILAYRNNKKGKSNINFSAEIISKIVAMEESFVLVGDFAQYFDKIEHRQLKDNLLEVLDMEKLSSDLFNVFQSVTKYGYYERKLLDEIFGNVNDLKRRKIKSYFNQLSEFRQFKKKYKVCSNKAGIGIPQGTAISATLANIYAINFDKKVNKIALFYGGLYRRYSDDFIMVLPKKNFKEVSEFMELDKLIRNIAQENKIEIQESKTGIYEYRNREIVNLKNKEVDNLDYLGFVFDGKSVQMRGKGPYKFYRKARKLILKAQSVKMKKGLAKIPYRRSLYKLYTDLGIDEGHGNYISYAKRSQKIFDEISPNTNNLMMNQIINRKKFIEKNLGIKLSIEI